MSSAGRAANSNGCVSKPKEHATGLIGFAAQIRRSSLIGSCAMETAEHREPCESRGSRTDLGAPGVRFLRATRPKRTPGRLHDSDLLQFMSTPSAMHRSNIFLRQ